LFGSLYQAAATTVNGSNANYLLALGADLLLPMELMEGGKDGEHSWQKRRGSNNRLARTLHPTSTDMADKGNSTEDDVAAVEGMR